MGIFNFLKDVGQKLFDRDQSQPAQNNSENLARKLEQKIQQLNLGIQNPKVRIEGDKAIVEGKAASQDAFEKAILTVGNTFGISQVDARIEAPEQVQPKFYTVKKGDTLSKIAKETLGNANEYTHIFDANRPLLKDPDEIYPGQQLRIPQDVKKAA